MFGYNKSKITSPRASSKKKNIYEAPPAPNYKEDAEASAMQDYQVSQKAQKSKEDRVKARAEGREYSKDVLGQQMEGLDPVKRQAMQYEANKGIQRSMQQANRKLLGDQGMRGIRGNSGVGYAQQRDLQRMASEAQGGVHRDLDKLDSDLAMKKLAAAFNIEQGEASQSQIDKQMALDELQLGEERRRQRFFEDQAYNQYNRDNKQFSRI